MGSLISICKMLDTNKIEDDLTIRLINGFKQSTNHLNDTLNDLIKILIIKENTSLPAYTLSFEEILQKVMATVYLILVNESVTIDTDFSNAPTVNFSSAYLESIFLNLLTNSIKYRNPKNNLLIKMHTSISTDGTTKLIYSDNGIGMNMERIKGKIFGLHQRFHHNTDSKGIGLYLIHSQITALGGLIDVTSEEHIGTTFTITFK